MAQRDGMRRLELISLHLASGAGCSVRPLLMVNHDDRAVDEWPLRADCVEKLENRGASKISQMSRIGDFSCCKAL
jgi:hypothetical protein